MPSTSSTAIYANRDYAILRTQAAASAGADVALVCAIPTAA